MDELKDFANGFDAEGREETKMRAFTPSYTVAARLQPDAGVMRATCERHATKLQQMAQIGSIVRLRPIGVLSWSMTSKLGEPTFSQVQMLDDAITDQDLRVPPSNRFEKLRGKLEGFTRSASTANGGSFFEGMAAAVKRRAFISMITVIAEVFHVDDEAQACDGRRDSRSGIHGADGSYAERFGQGHGCAAPARQRIVQRPQGCDSPNGTYTCPRVRQQSDFWLNMQRRSDIWEAMHSPRERERIKRARPIGATA